MNVNFEKGIKIQFFHSDRSQLEDKMRAAEISFISNHLTDTETKLVCFKSSYRFESTLNCAQTPQSECTEKFTHKKGKKDRHYSILCM